MKAWSRSYKILRGYWQEFLPDCDGSEVHVRTIALLATYNEERFIAQCIEHFARHGVEIYLLDNCSTDRTVSIAEAYLGRGLAGLETVPRTGLFALRPILERKQELASKLDADWFLHIDADERHTPTPGYKTLKEALEHVDKQGYNAVNFLEYTFIPTCEEPEHDHADYEQTMRWYYPFLPRYPHRLNAWKRQSQIVDLATSAGHRVNFPGLNMFPESFSMRHYLILSREHAITKFSRKRVELERQAGWGRARENVNAETVAFPSQSQLREYMGDNVFDSTEPWTKHFWLACNPLAELSCRQPGQS